MTLSGPAEFALDFVLVLVVYVLAWQRIEASPFGRLLHAMGEDAETTLALGKNVQRVRVAVFVFTGLWTGLAGGLWAFYLRYLDPSAFTLWESVLVVAIAVAAGNHGIRGVLAACALMLMVPELLRFAGLPQSIGAPLRQIIFGSALVVTVRLHARQSRLS